MTRAKARRSRPATAITTFLLDCILLAPVAIAAVLLKSVRRMGLHRLSLCRRVLTRIGVLPVRRHYYEPFFDETTLRRPLNTDRVLPGIDWNASEQLALLDSFRHAGELAPFATQRQDESSFYIQNTQFGPGDAEFLYQLIRLKKPSLMIEVGSGNSTLIAREALSRNHAENGAERAPRHICIEPFEAPWLEKIGVATVRTRLEDVDRALFQELRANDILFIDSTHMIRPQGDVVTEYLEIIPTLQPGVIVHIHDIFTPKDYPSYWVLQMMRLWNEQYLLEAFLTHNRSWKIIGALNYLYHHHRGPLKNACPFLMDNRQPGSFYIQRIA